MSDNKDAKSIFGNSTWQQGNQIYIHSLTITGGPGNYKIDYQPSLLEKIMSAIGMKLRHSPEVIEAYVRQNILGEAPK